MDANRLGILIVPDAADFGASNTTPLLTREGVGGGSSLHAMGPLPALPLRGGGVLLGALSRVVAIPQRTIDGDRPIEAIRQRLNSGAFVDQEM
jgi:hypothetical protein